MEQKFEELAQSLALSWRNGTRIPIPEEGAAPKSRADAFAIQDRMAELGFQRPEGSGQGGPGGGGQGAPGGGGGRRGPGGANMLIDPLVELLTARAAE